LVVLIVLAFGLFVVRNAPGTRCVPAALTSRVPLPPVSATPSDLVTSLVAAINAGDDATAQALMTPDAWTRYAGNGHPLVMPSTFGQVCSLDGFAVTGSAPLDPEVAHENLPEFAQASEVSGRAHLTPKTLWPFGTITPNMELDGFMGDDPDYYRQNYPEKRKSFTTDFQLVRQKNSDRWRVISLSDSGI